jgi:L-ascorbate metabolism protein UlaG (beta-lactamase superfamily)
MDTLLDVDMILTTHAHLDHFDDKAKELLNKNIELICQTEDVKIFSSYGFLKLPRLKAWGS